MNDPRLDAVDHPAGMAVDVAPLELPGGDVMKPRAESLDVAVLEGRPADLDEPLEGGPELEQLLRRSGADRVLGHTGDLGGALAAAVETTRKSWERVRPSSSTRRASGSMPWAFDSISSIDLRAAGLVHGTFSRSGSRPKGT